jgi:hypothetical protein
MARRYTPRFDGSWLSDKRKIGNLALAFLLQHTVIKAEESLGLSLKIMVSYTAPEKLLRPSMASTKYLCASFSPMMEKSLPTLHLLTIGEYTRLSVTSKSK